MMKFSLCLFVIFSNLVFCINGDTYRAAVVEYNVAEYDSIYDTVDTTLADYVTKISEAKAAGADIIIFPELTLNAQSPITVPDESAMAQPWNEPNKYSKVLNELSAAAYNEGIYVSVDVAEKELNETAESTENSYTIFNTNFVLDRTGTIISRYRKIHLYGEARTPSLDQKLGIFETDFGVRFGHFICFDLLFQVPAFKILNQNVSNIIFPTMWYSELPFLTGVQIQESWAYENNVNLLAAGANQPGVGSTGSGVYSGKNGRLAAVMYGTSKSEMLIVDVPKDPNQDLLVNTKNTRTEQTRTVEMDGLLLKPDNLTVYTSVIMSESGEYGVRSGDVICSVNITFVPNTEESTEQKQYIYRLVAYDGVRSYTYATGGVSDCAVVACTNSTIQSCATRFPNYSEVWPYNKITSIALSATVPKPQWNETMESYNRVFFPVTLDTSIMPISVEEYSYETVTLTEEQIEIYMEINNVEDLPYVLYAFGITGRVFERDGLPVHSKGGIIMGHLSLIMAMIVMSLLCVVNYN